MTDTDKLRTIIINRFTQAAVSTWNAEQDKDDIFALPREDQVETFIIGTLTGLFGICLQIAGPNQKDAIIKQFKDYLPDAAEQGLKAIGAPPGRQ